MRILYDHQAFTGAIYGGIPRYFADLMGKLLERGHKIDLETRFSNNFYIQQQPYFNGTPYNYFLGYRLTCAMLSHLNRAGSAIKLLSKGFDVFHPTFYNPYFLDFIGKKPFVITYHDAIKDKFGKRYGHLDNVSTETKASILAKAAKIIAVSENTKNDMIEVFNINPEKVVVIHHATNFQDVIPKPIGNLPEKYLLYVGGRSDYKHFLPFLRAVADILKQENVSLVCAGGGELTPDELHVINELEIANRIFHKNVNDDTLKTLYQKAMAFIFPSKYEGFGIPILEAFASECPVILSNSSCFPEVAQDAALYFDTDNEASIKDTIQNVITNPSQREALIQKGKKRFANFSIEKMTQQTLAVYESIV